MEEEKRNPRPALTVAQFLTTAKRGGGAAGGTERYNQPQEAAPDPYDESL